MGGGGDYFNLGYLERRRKKMALNRARATRAAAFVEAAVVHVLPDQPDPEFEAALTVVARAVREHLSPRALAWLTHTVDDPQAAGSIRWQELTRLEAWLARCALPLHHPSHAPRFTAGHKRKAQDIAEHPQRPVDLAVTRVPAPIARAIYGVARRANVAPATVAVALLTYGLERMAQALRESREVPSAVPSDVPRAPA